MKTRESVSSLRAMNDRQADMLRKQDLKIARIERELEIAKAVVEKAEIEVANAEKEAARQRDVIARLNDARERLKDDCARLSCAYEQSQAQRARELDEHDADVRTLERSALHALDLARFARDERIAGERYAARERESKEIASRHPGANAGRDSAAARSREL